MRGKEATVLALSGLAALATARELQIDDVPVECATICGPIVELTFKCDVDHSFDELRRLKRRKVEDEKERREVARDAAARLVPRRHHRRPNQNNEEAEATPTPALDAATPSNEAQPEAPPPQPAQDVQASPDAAPVFIATLPVAASVQEEQATPTPTPTPSMDATPPQPPPEAQQTPPSSSPSAPPEVPQPQQPPPPAISMPPLFAPIFGQPTSTITLTLAAPSVPPFPQLIPPVVIPVPQLPGLQPPPQESPQSTSESSSQPPPQPTPQPPPPPPPPQQPPPVQQQPPPRPPQPPLQQQPPPPALQPPLPRPSSRSSSSSTPQLRPPPAAATPPPQASSSAPAAVVPVMGGGPEKQPDKPADDRENAEKNCICGNKSFDVQLLAGMCQSCIRQSGNRANDMDFIMSQCNFSEARYTRDKDNLVYNIRVVAQKPMLAQSANAMGDAGRLPAGCAAAVAVAVSFVAGAALLL